MFKYCFSNLKLKVFVLKKIICITVHVLFYCFTTVMVLFYIFFKIFYFYYIFVQYLIIVF